MTEGREAALASQTPYAELPDRFVVLGVLGAGASGKVFAARDRESDARVAVKALRTTDPEALVLLKSEFRNAASIRHRNIVRLGELLEQDGRWFLTMALVEGVDMLSYVRPTSDGPLRQGSERDVPRSELPPLSPARLRGTLVQLLEGLTALHRAGTIHCDIKPSNVLVGRDGLVTILDFGVARRTHELGTMSKLGTPAYMAPEQVAGTEAGPEADLYAVGVFMYLALSGRLPFTGSYHDVLEAKLSGVPPPPLADDGTNAELKRLCLGLMHVSPSSRPSAAEVLACLGARDDTAATRDVAEHFVGRHDELARLARASSAARAGRPQVVVIRGESGVGKSRLVEAFLESLARDSPRPIVVRGRCYEQESSPYKALDGIVDDLTAWLRELPDEQREALVPADLELAGTLFPALAGLAVADTLGRADDLRANPHELRRRAVQALRELLRRVCLSAPLIIAVDDMHWATSDSLQLMDDLLSALDAPPLLLVMTTRPTSTAMSAADRTWPCARDVIELGALTLSDARELVHRLCAAEGVPASNDQAELLDVEARGHPLFLRELVLQRKRRGDLRGALRLDDAILSRVDELGANARSAVELASLAGVPIRQELLGELLELPYGEVREILSELRAAALIQGTGVRRFDLVAPYHDRVRESVVARIDAPRKTSLHARLAEALARDPATPVDLLASHWELAGEPERAQTATLRAAESADRALAFDHAARLYRRVLDRVLEPAVRANVLQKLGDALRNGGRGAEAAAAYQQAAALCVGVAARDLRRRAAEQLMTSGEFEAGRAAFRAVLAEEGLHVIWLPWLAVAVGLLRRLWLGVRGLHCTLREEHQADPALLREMDVLWDVMRGLSLIDLSLTFDLGARLVQLALRAGEPKRLCRFLCVEGIGLLGSGNQRRGTELVRRGGAMLDRDEDGHTRAMHTLGVALPHLYANRWHAAAAGTEVAMQQFLAIGAGIAWELAFVRVFQMAPLFRAGHMRRLRIATRDAYDDAKRRGDLFAMTNSTVAYGAFTEFADDAPEVGRARVRDLLARWRGTDFLYQHYLGWMYEVHADLYCGRVADAWSRVESTWPKARRALLLMFPEIAHEAHHFRARSALAYAHTLPVESRKRRELARRALADARWLDRRQLPWPRANAAQIYAGCAALQGDVARASEHLRRAHDGYEQNAMTLHAAACRRELGRLVGGAEGDALRRDADAAMAAEEVRHPARFAFMLASGVVLHSETVPELPARHEQTELVESVAVVV